MKPASSLRLAAFAVALTGMLLPPSLGAEAEAVWDRVVNAVGGPVQTRLGDSGPWVTLGHVIVPATRTAPGFGAGRWATPGTIAATAVHGIRIRVSDGEFGPMISLVPKEFAAIPEFYGGHVPGQSGIRTDIRSGTTLFREFAPLVGSPVYLELAGGPMAIPPTYKPAPGDVLLIRSRWPSGRPCYIEFANRKGGAVSAVYADGRKDTIGKVSQPARGVGRFDGTSYTGVGNINTNHPGVVTIATAPVSNSSQSEGAPPERRGGFMISPSRHVADQAAGSPQVMGVAPNPGDPGWEGRFPIFSGCIGLWPPGEGRDGFHAEMEVDNGPWEPFPAMIGRDDKALTATGLPKYLDADGKARGVKDGVTAVRIVIPDWDPSAAAASIDAAKKAEPPARREPTGVYTLAKGHITYSAKARVRTVTYIVDGDTRAVGNSSGFTWTWDTTKEANGRHWLEIVREDRFGASSTELRRVLVLNGAG